MKYLSLFSGIEAFSQAVHDFGWTCVGVSEIDPFACEVLKQRLPTVQNLGDITKITKEKLNDLKEIYNGIDLVVGGSPCQSFSVAGLRKGLEDPRGNLMLEYVRVVATVRPSWFIWENVPGALSSGKGQDFGTLLQAMAQLGYSLGWRVLDAQHYGVPQRRRRVFLVGSLNKKDGPFKVLFERQSGKGNSDTSAKKGQSDTSKVETSIGKHGETGGGGGKKEESGKGNESQKVMMFNPAQPNNDAIETDKSVSLIARMGTGGNQVPLIVEENKQITMLQNNQWNARIHENATESFTLTAAMGEGGGHVPMIVEEDKVYVSAQIRTSSAKELKGSTVAPTVLATYHKNGDGVPLIVSSEYYEHHPNDSRVKGPKDIGCSVTARYGTGGGNIPLVVEQSLHEPRKQCCGYDEKSNTLAGFSQQPNIAIVEHDCSNFTQDNVAAPLRVACATSTLTIEHTPCDLYNTSIDESGKVASITTQSNHTGSGPRLIEHEMEHELCSTLCARDYKGPATDDFTATSQKLVLEHQHQQHKVQSKVRKLTPIECERLQGFPDDYTRIPYRKKPAEKCPHSPRYKALGNSMAVPVMRWLACRIALIDGLLVPSFRPIVVEKKESKKTYRTQSDESYTLQAHSGTTPAVVVEK